MPKGALAWNQTVYLSSVPMPELHWISDVQKTQVAIPDGQNFRQKLQALAIIKI